VEWNDYLRALRRSWWIVVLVAVVGAAAGFFLARGGEETYVSESRLVIGPNPDLSTEESAAAADVLDNSPAVVVTFSELLSGDQFGEQAAQQQGLDPAEASKYTVGSVVAQESNVVQLTVSGPDPQVASNLATEVSGVATEYFQTLYQGFDVQVFDGPSVPSTSSGPTELTTAFVAAVIGLGLGVVIAFVRELVAPAAPPRRRSGSTAQSSPMSGSERRPVRRPSSTRVEESLRAGER